MPATLLDISPDEYHTRPGLSASIATTLIKRSPMHAWQEHPAFGARGKEPTKAMDRGTVLHHLVLGKGKDFRVLDFDDWRTSKAKEARDQARAEGLVPILASAYQDAYHAAVAIMRALVDRGVQLDGDSEQAMEWEEPGDAIGARPVQCRGMMDHLTADRLLIYDLKIVESAAPESIERSAESFGYAIQWAAYTSGHGKVFPHLAGRARMRFVFAEAEPPHAVNIVEPDGVFREIGERRWRRAVNEWGRCLRDNEWPAYGTGINTISSPPWALAREGFTYEER